MKMVVTFAVFPEFRPWARLRPFRGVAAGGLRCYEARIGGTEVRVLLTGVGARKAAEVVRHALEYAPGLFIVSGLAGGLRPEYRPGDVLAARSVCASQEGSCIRSEERFLGLAVDCGARLAERFLSVKSIARKAAEKSRLGSSADAVEMESYALMSEIAPWGIPVLALRGISDPVERDLPFDFERMLDGDGRLRISRAALEMYCSPRDLLAMIRFGLESRRAAALLARYLDRFAENLSAQKRTPNPATHNSVHVIRRQNYPTQRS